MEKESMISKAIKYINQFYHKYTIISVILITISISALFVAICFWLTDLDIHPVENSTMPIIDKINSASIIVLTLLIVLVAWFQLEKLKDISKKDLNVTESDFLLRIINHFSDKSIIQALEIIHRMRLDSENKNGHNSDTHTSFIAKEIRDIRDDPNNIGEYMLLKNFLDYLEHIAYLSNEGYISIKDIENCMGERITDYYDYFRDLINYFKFIQPSRKDNIYKQLKLLVDTLNLRQ
jgi:hypothetical protein